MGVPGGGGTALASLAGGAGSGAGASGTGTAALGSERGDASDAVWTGFPPGLSVTVLTTTGRIGSAEPTEGGVGAAADAACQRGTWTVVVTFGSDLDVRVTGTLMTDAVE